MKAHYDVAIVGSGFAGSLLAMIARRQGRSVVLLEKGRHPRFAMANRPHRYRICCWRIWRGATIFPASRRSRNGVPGWQRIQI